MLVGHSTWLFSVACDGCAATATCGEGAALNRPGHSEDARGSAFNPDGISGTHYAGEQPQNSKNPKSVSQYDVACSHTQSPP